MPHHGGGRFGYGRELQPAQQAVATYRPLRLPDDRKRPVGFGGRLLSWLMGIPSENSPCSGLNDTIDELAILHAPLAKPSDRLPQFVTIIREPIFRFRRHLLIDRAFQKPVAFEVAQS